ncbi:uncharacterized protein LOC106665054 isoform X2 [Cimex lectularius]|uniref:protein-tyrosine-phosphatase n=1 Tax=Cimex lectularius TaxID=79782 RepID=A0A8I6RJP8_CIMLE|nr:uncharacterized protein LOC106665054 isoform X2 [Cimex lectularius]XP_014246703.1 uncharacterized protein LOC106665054 isoform X2 [Cimex lectularius]
MSEDGFKMPTGLSSGSIHLPWRGESGTVLFEHWQFIVLVSLASALALAFIVLVWLKAQMSSQEKRSSAGEGGGDEIESTQWICHPVIQPTVTEQCESLPQEQHPPCASAHSVVTEAVSGGESKMGRGGGKIKGLLERRGSSASLTIDLVHQENIAVTPMRECTTEEYLLSASNVLTRQQLRSCLKDVRAIHREFWDLPLNHPDKILVPGSWAKNRYRTVIPNENTRVHLPTDDTSTDNLSGYINANYIKGYDVEQKAFIATQGPMTNTVNDLWEMVWSERSPVIVMITKLWEKSRPKCEAYLPTETNVAVMYGKMSVSVTNVVNKDGYTIRNVQLQKDEEVRKLLHYWFDSWPDHKTPANAHSLLSLAKEVETARFQGVPQRRPSAVWLSGPPPVKDTISPIINFGPLEIKADEEGETFGPMSLDINPQAVNVELLRDESKTMSYESSPSKKRTKQSADYERTEQRQDKCFFKSPFPSDSVVFKFGSPHRINERSKSEESRDSSTAFDFDMLAATADDSLSKNADTVLWKLEKLSTNSTGSYETAQSPGWSIDKSGKLSVDSPNYTAETSPLTGSDRSPFRTNSSFDSPAFSSSGSKRWPTQSSGDSSIWTASEDSPIEGTSPKMPGPVSPGLLSPRWLEGNRGTPVGPVIVHCSAGIGRTGCFIAICIGVSQLLSENSVDILGIVCKMRHDRGGMVQTAEQYEFIHRALAMFERSLPDQSGE